MSFLRSFIHDSAQLNMHGHEPVPACPNGFTNYMSICNHVELEKVLAHAVPVQTVSTVKASISVCSTDMNSGSAEPARATAKTVIDSPDRAELVSTYVHLASLTFENKLMAICRAGERMVILRGPAS